MKTAIFGNVRQDKTIYQLQRVCNCFFIFLIKSYMCQSIDGIFNARQPETGKMMSVSDDSEYYKEKRGSLSLLHIVEGLPMNKSSRESQETSRDRIDSIPGCS
jgi:hypothetical protein